MLDFDIFGLNKHCSKNSDDPIEDDDNDSDSDDSDELRECSDNPIWKFNGTNKRTCAWVAKNPGKRCRKEANGVYASTACPIACNSDQCTILECKDNDDWEVELKVVKLKIVLI